MSDEASNIAATWADNYEETIDDYESAAEAARRAVLDVLRGGSIAIHQVTSRAKLPASVRTKLRSKKYVDPATQMTDLLGVRVITTYEHGVRDSTDAIRNAFRIDEENSIDKTSTLGEDKFGYRGVHLVAKIRTGSLDKAGEILKSTFVEVQIRSVVEHAWAEIDHELRYKSGIPFPHELDRRFNAVAGTLEMVDREFSAIVRDLISVVDRLAESYRHDGVNDQTLDTAALLAVLQLRRSDAPKVGPGGVKLKLNTAREFVMFLAEVGIESAGALDAEITSQPVRNSVHDYAASRGITPANVSASAVLGIILGLRDIEVLAHTELAKDWLLKQVIQAPD